MKLFFEKEQEKERKSDTVEPGNQQSAELTDEDIAICKKVIPPQQFGLTLELTEGEEGEHFKNKLKEIADTYRRISTDEELVNEDGSHNVGFRYFLGNSEFFVSEIDKDGICFGYNILNGDLEMSEWGSTELEAITSIPFIEMDYYIPEGATIEGSLHKEHPEYFPEYSPEKKARKNEYSRQIWGDYIENVRAFLPEKDFNNKAKVLKASKMALASLVDVASGMNIVNGEFSKRGVKDEKSLVMAIREAAYPELARELRVEFDPEKCQAQNFGKPAYRKPDKPLGKIGNTDVFVAIHGEDFDVWVGDKTASWSFMHIFSARQMKDRFIACGLTEKQAEKFSGLLFEKNGTRLRKGAFGYYEAEQNKKQDKKRNRSDNGREGR